MKRELTVIGILSLSFVLLNLSNAVDWSRFEEAFKPGGDIERAFKPGGAIEQTFKPGGYIEQGAKAAGKELTQVGQEIQQAFQHLDLQKIALDATQNILSSSGIQLNKIIIASENIKHAINDFPNLINRIQEITTGTNGPIHTVQTIQDQISIIKDNFQRITNKSHDYVSSGQLLEFIQLVLTSLQEQKSQTNSNAAIAKAPALVQQDIKNIKDAVITLYNSLQHVQIRAVLNELLTALAMITNILDNIQEIITSTGKLGPALLPTVFVASIQEINNTLHEIHKELTIIAQTPPINAAETIEQLITGIFNHIDTIPTLVTNLTTHIQSIIIHVNTLGIYPSQIQEQINALINDAKKIPDNIKNEIINQLKNIPNYLNPINAIQHANQIASQMVNHTIGQVIGDIRKIFNSIHDFIQRIQIVTQESIEIEHIIKTNLETELIPTTTLEAINRLVQEFIRLLDDFKPLLP